MIGTAVSAASRMMSVTAAVSSCTILLGGLGAMDEVRGVEAGEEGIVQGVESMAVYTAQLALARLYFGL